MSNIQAAKNFNLGPIAMLALFLLMLDGCSAIGDLANSVQKPRLSVTDVKVTGFDFNGIDMAFNVKVDNPNALSVQMVSYDYSLGINKQRLVSGTQNKETRIGASSASNFEIPVRLNFREVYSTVESLANSDDATYDFQSTFTFDLPYLGKTEVPVTKAGEIPLLKMPKISVRNLRVENVSLSSADLSLQLAFDNPNGIGFNINNFDYNLTINGSSWAEGQALQGVSIAEKGTAPLEIPIKLNIAQMGMSVFNMLTSSNDLEYDLKGNFSLGAVHPLLGNTSFDFDREGRIPLVSGN